MFSSTFFLLLMVTFVLVNEHASAMYLSKKGNHADSDNVMDPKKRPFCNAFTGCGRKRSNLPALTGRGEPIEDSIGSLLELNAEPAVEDLSRQIMSEAKLWEAIQEANLELSRRRQESAGAKRRVDIDNEDNEDNGDEAGFDRAHPPSCAIPPCVI